MKKEIIIVIIIVAAIIITDILTQKYTKNSFLEISGKLDEIEKIGKALSDEKEKNSEKTDGYVKNKTKLEETIEKMQNDWREINRKTAFYIEHDELEKVNSAMVKFKSFFSLEQYEEAISELENCRYILNHIKEKSALEIINLF